MSAADAPLKGERNLPAVRSAATLQARISHALALALMLAMGAIVLFGYYRHMAHRQEPTSHAQLANRERAQSEMSLPALAAMATEPISTQPPAGVSGALAGPVSSADAVPLARAPAPSMAPAGVGPASAHASNLERRLTGNAFEAAGDASAGAESAAGREGGGGAGAMPAAIAGAPSPPRGGELAALVPRPNIAGAAPAHRKSRSCASV